MRKLLARSFIALLAMSFFVINAPATYACSCIAPSSPQESLLNSDAVFVGTVTDLREIGPSGFEATFDVSQSWKGIEHSTAVISTAHDSAGCGFGFVEGKEYVVYAHETEDGSLSTGLCSRTHERIDDDEDVAALGSGAVPTETPSPTGATGSQADTTSDTDWQVPGVVAAIVVIMVIIWARRYSLEKKK